MKILVTGSNGLLGQKLINLLQKDDNVYTIATARKKLVPQLMRGEFHGLDIEDAEQVNRVLSETKPDVVINTAAMTQVDDCELNHEACWKANVTSVENLINACSKDNIRLIHLSTDFIFDGTHGPLDENAKPNPISYYGSSKLAAEELIQRSSLSWCILRTVLVYGITEDMSRSNIVLWVKKNLEDKKTIRVVNDQWRTPTLAEDLAMGCHLAAIKMATGIFNISGKDFITPYHIAIKAADFFHLDKSFIQEVDSTIFTQPAKRPLKTGFIIDKAKEKLGYEPHSFEEGIAIMAAQL